MGPCPDGMECCHDDGDPQNNCVENLRWDTHWSNMLDRERHGTLIQGERFFNAKLTLERVQAIHALKSVGWTNCKIGRIFDVSDVTVWRVLSGAGWKHCPPEKGNS